MAQTQKGNTRTFQRLLGHLRRAVTDYQMIQPGDRVGVGVSGGKDSMALLAGLSRLRQFLGIPFDLTAITVDPCFDGVPMEDGPIRRFCRELEIPYWREETRIGELVFQVRREENPCSLCAHMRRGALVGRARALGCGKLALGHNRDDALETFVMCLLQEGRFSCFSPVTEYPGDGAAPLTLIRPLIYAQEWETRRAAEELGIEYFKLPCPNDGNSSRQWAKEWLAARERETPGIGDRIFGAIRKEHLCGW